MSDWLRQFVRERAGFRCEYCHLPDRHPLREAFHLEHIKARQHGGQTVVENLAWACHRCNLYKGPNLSGVDPDSQETVLSPITSKPASQGRIKTGHSEVVNSYQVS